MKNIVLFLLVIVGMSSCSTETADLSLKLEIGQQYYQTSSMESTISQIIDGQEMESKITLDGCTMYDVIDSTGDEYIIDISFKQLAMTMDMASNKIVFDTDVPDNSNPMYKILKFMIDKPFGMKMNTKGKITQIDNSMELWDEGIDQFEVLSEEQKSQIKAQIQKSYGPEALKGSIEMLTAVYPDHIVNTGDTWTVHTTLEAGMSAKVTTEYKFVDKTSNHCLISGVSTLQSANKDAYIEINGMPTKYDISGEMTSEITIDNTTGWITKATIIQNIGGDIYIKKNPKMPDGMKIPMTAVNKMTITDEP